MVALTVIRFIVTLRIMIFQRCNVNCCCDVVLIVQIYVVRVVLVVIQGVIIFAAFPHKFH